MVTDQFGTPLPVPRSDVYMIIDGERDYQDRRWGGTDHDASHSLPAFLCFMQHHLTRAIAEASSKVAPITTLNQVRKVAALCVATMELFGAPSREQEEMSK